MLDALTVVIPVWSEYVHRLPALITSVRQQGTPGLHVVIVDNASEVEVQAEEDDIVVVRLPERVSLAQARNVGLEHVQTPYVAFLDADDVLMPGAYRSLLRYLQDHPRIDGVCGDHVKQFEDGTTAVGRTPTAVARLCAFVPTVFAAYMIHRNGFFTMMGIVRTKKFIDCGGFPETYHEDWGAAIALASDARLRVVHVPVLKYLIRPQSRLHSLSADETAAHDLHVRRWARDSVKVGRIPRMVAHAYVSIRRTHI